MIFETKIVRLMYCSQAIAQADMSHCGFTGGYALTRQNCDPDKCRGACLLPGEPNGESTAFDEAGSSSRLSLTRLRSATRPSSRGYGLLARARHLKGAAAARESTVLAERADPGGDLPVPRGIQPRSCTRRTGSYAGSVAATSRPSAPARRGPMTLTERNEQPVNNQL